MDVFSFLLNGHNGVAFVNIRDYQKSEGYTMMLDGFVTKVTTVPFQEPGYCAVKAEVKPRTRDRDPVTGAKFYHPWVIITSVGTDKRSCILSSFCTCKGGIDGFCRHVQAVLYEIIDFRDDQKKESVTSGPCQWIRRETAHQKAALLTDVVTTTNNTESKIRPIQGQYTPVPDISVLSPVDDFLKGVKRLHPDACMLYTWEKQTKDHFQTPPLNCTTPTERMEEFYKEHTCNGDCECDCAEEFLHRYAYNKLECSHIEVATRGQHQNKNWHKMRKGLVTASNVKKVMASTNEENTAAAILKGSSLDKSNLPPAVRFGRDNEHLALQMFGRSHRYRHRKCKLWKPGFVTSTTLPFLGASPDAYVQCDHKECGTLLVEVKCSYTFRNFHPKHALKEGSFCIEDNGEYKLKPTHDYFHQIQCQMGVTGVHKCVLCVYTKKGIETVNVPFDEEYWATASVKIKNFWKTHMFRKP